jgi:site-specific DNA recombinase
MARPRKAQPTAAPTKQMSLLNRAAIYLRVSTDDQVTDGYGLDVQRERCTAQAVAKGWQIVGEYCDEGISGTKGIDSRPGLKAMLKDAETGKIDAIIVLALDRLGRKTNIVLDIADKCRAWNTALVSCKESLDTATPQGQFVLTMFAALAQLERDTIVERTTAGRNERGKRDGEKGGRVPLGYTRTPDNIILIDDNGAAIVRRIFALRDGGLSMAKIAEALGSTPTARGGKRWYASSVREVLLNEADYRGGKRGDSDLHWPMILIA